MMAEQESASAADGPEGIAIVGMAGRFPGAPDIRSFWRRLRGRADSVTRFRPEEAEDAYTPEERARPDYVGARPILENVELFDAALFGMRPREAALTDPQHRVFLEICWEALEDAGHDPRGCAGRDVGVYAGCSLNTYLLRHVCGDRAAVDRFLSDYQVGSYDTLVGNFVDSLATRVAYKLDLRGPAMSVATACSTSLTAVAQAVQALLLHQCEMALAGGVSITLPQRRGYFSQDGGMVSPDGTCRPFDAGANGTIFGSGAGVVLLKRLESALADGDHVYAVIRGAAVNNDGASKVGFTAPSVNAQAEVVATAQAIAGFDPASIGYVECHGTATPLGDPIEVAALAKAFGPAGGPGSCFIGSVKGHVGHLDAAAGVTGLIKAALAVESGIIPSTLNFRSPNPRLQLDRTPFAVADRLTDWPVREGPRRAGVSALGVGGTNVHLCIEQAPAASRAPSARPSREVLLMSARSAEGLVRAREALAARLREDPALALGDVAYTLATGRHPFPHRCAVVAASREEAIERLGAGQGLAIVTAEATRTARPVLFMFPGQGAQYRGMGGGLYAEEPVFREAMDRCAAILQPRLGLDLREALYGAIEGQGADAIRQTLLAQPAIFAVEYALAQLWMSRGVQPTAMIGHSVGEFVAATLSGVFTLEDALAVVAARGRLMQSLPGGAMLAVRLPEAELLPLLPEDVAIGAVNGPALTVAAGPENSVARLEATLAARGAMHRRLHTSHAFHSAMMEPILGALEAEVARVPLGSPAIPYVSCVTGNWITEAEARSSLYWARHCRAPVRFADGLATLLAGHETALLLEIGPGATLGTLALQGAMRGAAASVVTSLPGVEREAADAEAFATAWGRLWAAGGAVEATHAAPPGRRVPLPPTPFEHKRHWIDLKGAPPAEAAAPLRLEKQEEARMQPSPSQILETGKAIIALFEDLSGNSLAGIDPDATNFLELGFDSLFLGQVAQQLQARFGVKVSFRQLMSNLDTLGALTSHIAGSRPPEAAAAPMPAPMPAPAIGPAPAAAAPVAMPALTVGGEVQALLQAQLAAMTQLMQAQLAALGSPAAAPVAAAPAAPVALPAPPPPAPKAAAQTEMTNRFSRFTNPSQARASAALTEEQQRFVEALAIRLEAKAPRSKTHTQQYRAVHADPRTAAGFRPEWKELVFPLVCDRAAGGRVTDLDGNSYIDLVSGFGPVLLGHAEEAVVEAVIAEMRRGAAIGPQAALAGPVAELIAEFTGAERVSFCCTGSEAVMGAMRLARAVTGRKRVVSFAGAYHGGFDEVLVRGVRLDGLPRTLPAAPGITDEAVSNLTVLEYDDPEALNWIETHAHELAAVLVEPVQSRHPGLQPRAFLERLRAVTEASGTALIFDEVVTGFRLHPRGAQGLFGITADLLTYGKVLGGGLPIGVLAGKGRFMDALDGGHWSYGDASGPETDVTIFAGTFVRHPLAMAAAHAMLTRLKAEGPALWGSLERNAARLSASLDACLSKRGIPARIERCGTLLQLNLALLDRRASLLYPLLREHGVFAQEGFAMFMTAAHGPAECDLIVKAFEASLGALQSVGILAPATDAAAPAAPALAPPPANPTQAPLTEAQMEIWLAAQNGDEPSCAFNEAMSVELTGSLDVAALKAALHEAVARHDALRAYFSADGDHMLIAPVATLPFTEDDIAALEPAAQEAALATITDTDARTPFDLVAGSPIRARLVRRGPKTHVLMVTVHHILCDGWSTNILLRETAAIYAARCGKQESALPPAPSFAALAGAEQARDTEEAALAYWLKRLASPPSPLELPTDRPRPSTRSFRGATETAFIGAELLQAVRAAGAKRGCTTFVTLLAAFQVLLGRLAGQTAVTVGVPMAGQSMLEGHAPVGHCVNFLPLQARWTEETSFAGLLTEVKEEVLAAREHQRCTFGTIIRRLGLPREAGRLPLTDVQFNLERLADLSHFGELTATLKVNPKAFVNFDLFFNIAESDTGLRIDCDYSTDLFDRATIQRWLAHFRTLLAAAAKDADMPIVRMPLLSATERQVLLEASNQTEAAFPADARVDQLFAAHAARRPGAVAASCGDSSWTYRELDQRVDALAASLRDQVGGPGARIGVLLDRSLEMLMALLAVSKAGCTYVPLDPFHPPARLGLIVERSDLALLLTDASLPALPIGVPCLRLDQPLPLTGMLQRPAAVEGNSTPAYVIFTSGSTGVPKGVQVGHAALINLLSAMAAEPGFTERDALLAITTPAFDIAALELFLPLVTGGRVIIATREEVTDGFALQRRLQTSGATVLQATPATWRMLLEAGFRSHPGLAMLCGGEALPRDLADDLLVGGGALWNMYGPTETTIWSSVSRILPDGQPVTIGNPIANTRFYVLDDIGELVPPGVPGELHIAGAGLADGYFRDLAQTADRFVTETALPSERLYRTGDLARRFADGRLALLGRVDSQVKLRGFRIELGEIEAALTCLPNVATAAVVLHNDPPQAPRLVAYLTTPTGTPPAPEALRVALAETLPDYMVPSSFMHLAALPLTPNGKVDRCALPAPSPEAAPKPVPATPTEAATPQEAKLARIWAEVLGVESVKLNQSLLDLGADSLQIFQITARANRAGISLTAKDLMRHQSIRAVCASRVPATSSGEAAASQVPSLAQFRRMGAQ